jgi:hypothetical protein
MRYERVTFAFKDATGGQKADTYKDSDGVVYTVPPTLSNKEVDEAPFYGQTPQKTYLDERIPWSALDGFLNMGLLPVLLLAATLWALRTKNVGAFVGFGLSFVAIVATAFLKYGGLAWGGLIANVFATAAIFAVVGLMVALFGSMLTSLFRRS